MVSFIAILFLLGLTFGCFECGSRCIAWAEMSWHWVEWPARVALVASGAGLYMLGLCCALAGFYWAFLVN